MITVRPFTASSNSSPAYRHSSAHTSSTHMQRNCCLQHVPPHPAPSPVQPGVQRPRRRCQTRPQRRQRQARHPSRAGALSGDSAHAAVAKGGELHGGAHPSRSTQPHTLHPQPCPATHVRRVETTSSVLRAARDAGPHTAPTPVRVTMCVLCRPVILRRTPICCEQPDLSRVTL